MATVVLVHGATAGGWVWKAVAPRLAAAGHTVYTPTLTGLGERVHLLTHDTDLDTHIMDIVNVLVFEKLVDVILVGHSYGGMVITGVAERMPERIARLVYLDAVVPHDRESLSDSIGASMRAEQDHRVATEGDGWLFPVIRGPNDATTRNVPHPYKCYTQLLRVANPEAAAIPRVYVRHMADKEAGTPFAQRLGISWQRAKAGGWPVYEIDAVHQITPNPQPIAEVLTTIMQDMQDGPKDA